MALTYLKKSIDAGYTNYQHIQEDSDLNNIRKEKEFIDLNNYLRSIGDYLYILKKADQYNANDSRSLPIFSYQSSENPNLMALRKALNLDSIAGKGSDVLKILNLLHWMHNLIPHDGNHNNPVVKNAMSMIAECKRDNRGLNCRGLATVLNECYLSLGIKSRIVTCLPKDSLKMDNDCHVINSVYSETLKKWLWIDPTFNAYVLNENGELLSIEEVRTRIIQNKPLIINPDANWNNRNLQTKEYYLLNYMAKNLYILECPVVSEYNMETIESGRVFNYIQLLPLDYFKQSPDKSENKDEKTNTEQYNAWQTIQRSHAVANGLHVVSVNRVGFEQNGAMKFWGGSFIANPFGSVVYKASHDAEEIHVQEIDLSLSDGYRTHWPFLRDRRIDSYQPITKRYIDED